MVWPLQGVGWYVLTHGLGEVFVCTAATLFFTPWARRSDCSNRVCLGTGRGMHGLSQRIDCYAVKIMLSNILRAVHGIS